MTLKLETKFIEGDVVLMRVQGRLMLGKSAAEFRNRIRELIAQNHRNFVLDLSDLRFLDSSGTGELVVASSTLEKANGEIAIAAPTDKVRKLFYVTSLNAIFKCFDTVDEATAYLQRSKVRGSPPAS